MALWDLTSPISSPQHEHQLAGVQTTQSGSVQAKALTKVFSKGGLEKGNMGSLGCDNGNILMSSFYNKKVCHSTGHFSFQIFVSHNIAYRVVMEQKGYCCSP